MKTCKLLAFLLLSLSLSLAVMAQDKSKKAEPPKAVEPKVEAVKVDPLTLTESEKFKLRSIETEQLSAQLAVRNAEDESTKAKARLLLAQDRLSEANTALTAAVDQVFTSHKIEKKDAALCDGPANPPCDKVGKGDLALVKVK